MGQNTSAGGLGGAIHAGINWITGAPSTANKDYKSAADNYKDALNNYTGNQGYKNSLEQGKAGASIAAQNAQAQSQTAARNSGASRAQAALLGSQQNANAYLNNLNTQQQAAAQQGANQVNSYGTLMSAQSSEGQNQYNRNMQNFGINTMGLGTLMASDERLKVYHDVSSKMKYNDPELLKKLVWKQKCDNAENYASSTDTDIETSAKDMNSETNETADSNNTFSEWAKNVKEMIKKRSSQGYQPIQAASFNGNPGISMR